jgi:hypothetical protein
MVYTCVLYLVLIAWNVVAGGCGVHVVGSCLLMAAQICLL